MKSRIRCLGAVAVLLLGTSHLSASDVSQAGNADGVLSGFVRAEYGARSCWMAEVDPAQLAAEPHRTAKSVALSMQTEISPPDTDWPEGRTLNNYELAIDFTDGRRARALGNCLPHGADALPHGADAIACSVECDGGGVVVTHAGGGAIGVDFAPFGGIRLNYCGEPGEALRFRPTGSEARFTLSRRPQADCPTVTMPDWDAGID